MIKDRIVDLRRVRAGDLLANPKNWRKHPERQRDAMRGMLEEIGYADAVLARELEDGRLMLIDGHLRQDLDAEQVLPVLVVDVTEAEADKLLVALDPLASMAKQDDKRLSDLLATVDTASIGLKSLLDDLSEGITPPQAPVKPEVEISPELLERQDYLVVTFDNALDWQVACEKLGVRMVAGAIIKPESSLVTRGTGRVVRAAKLLEALK